MKAAWGQMHMVTQTTLVYRQSCLTWENISVWLLSCRRECPLTLQHKFETYQCVEWGSEGVLKEKSLSLVFDLRMVGRIVEINFHY